jgi:hypothetical protein
MKMALVDVRRLSAGRVVNTYPGTAEDQSGASPLILPAFNRFQPTSANTATDEVFMLVPSQSRRFRQMSYS